MYLKLGPVHGHARALISPEPLQILFSISSRDCVFQCLVDCLKSTKLALEIIF